MSLAGKKVLVLEARLPEVLADLVTRAGGEPVCVPAVVEEDVSAEDVAEALGALCGGGADLAIFQTGVGAERLHHLAAELGLGDAYLETLRRVPVVVRGPKPAAVLHRWGVRPARAAASPHTTAELLAVLMDAPLWGKRVFVQHYSQPNEELRAFLHAQGAATIDALPYRWGLPGDLAPLRRAIEGLLRAEFDAVLVTSRPQIDHLIQTAREGGLEEALRNALNTRVAVAVVGPVAGRAVTGAGVRIAVEPQQPKMAPLVRALDEHFGRTPNS